MKSLSSNTAIIVDSACDLPPEMLQQRGIFVIPIGFRVGEKHFRDRRVPQMASEFNSRVNVNSEAPICTAPTSIDTIRNFIIANIVDHFENLLIMCISSTRSEIYNNATKAVQMLPAVIFQSRSKTPVKLKNIEVVDTLSVFSGQGLLAYFASSLTPDRYDVDLRELVDIVKDHSSSVSTYVIPNDLAYLKNRGKVRNEKCISCFDYLIAQTFGLRPIIKWQRGKSKKIAVRRGFKNALIELGGIVRDAISEGLKYQSVMVSYSGDIERFKQCEEYIALEEHAQNHDVSLVLSTMSITAAVYLGPEAISISYCQ